MDLKQEIRILEKHQNWRMGAEIPMTHPRDLTEAMNIAISTLKTLNP